MKKVFLFLLSIVLIVSCGETTDKTGTSIGKLGKDVKSALDIKRYSMGSAFEVLLVCEDEVWESTAGMALKQALDTPVPGLPQQEASFKVTRRNYDNFGSTEQAFRNIILVDINNSYSKCEFRFERNVYAEPQIVMAIYAPDKRSFGEYVNKNAQVIVDFFNEKEREYQINELGKKYNKEIMSLILQKFGCTIMIPSNINGRKSGRDFVWISDYNNPSKVEIMNFAVYSYPYTSYDNFSKEYFIQKRDSFMKENIPGSEPDSYIQTEKNTVSLEDAEYNGKYMSIARGSWYMKNDDMFGGGPFVSHSIVDETYGRVIVVEAFVYAPNKEKRGYMRKLEASLYTLQLPLDLEY